MVEQMLKGLYPRDHCGHGDGKSQGWVGGAVVDQESGAGVQERVR